MSSCRAEEEGQKRRQRNSEYLSEKSRQEIHLWFIELSIGQAPTAQGEFVVPPTAWRLGYLWRPWWLVMIMVVIMAQEACIALLCHGWKRRGPIHRRRRKLHWHYNNEWHKFRYSFGFNLAVVYVVGGWAADESHNQVITLNRYLDNLTGTRSGFLWNH